MKRKYDYVDLMKTIAMFLVMLFHILLCFSHNPYWFVYADYENEAATFLCNILSCTVVPIFVFCSGFLFQTSLQRKNIKTTTAILNRGKRLLIPYFLYTIIWLVPTYTIFDIPVKGRMQGASLFEGYRSMLLGQFSDVAWFLSMLFWVSLIWTLFRKFLAKERFLMGSITTIILYFLAHNLLSNAAYYSINQLDIYIVIFFVGASFFWITDQIEKLSLPILMLLSISGIAICTVLAQYAASNYWLTCLLAVVMPLLAALFAIGLCKFRLYASMAKTPQYKWLLTHNMDIYLLQAPAMYVTFLTFYPLVGKNCFLCVLLSYLATILIDFILVALLTYLKKSFSR